MPQRKCPLRSRSRQHYSANRKSSRLVGLLWPKAPRLERREPTAERSTTLDMPNQGCGTSVWLGAGIRVWFRLCRFGGGD